MEEGICESNAFKNNSCVSGVWNKFKQNNIAFNLVKKFLDESPKAIDLCMDIKSSFESGKETLGGRTYRKDGNVQIDFNWSRLKVYPELITAQTMIHEIIHAEMLRKIESVGGSININDFPGIFDYYSRYVPIKGENGNTHYPDGTPQHNLMANHYIKTMAEALMEYDGSTGLLESYEAMAWLGLEKTDIWNSLTTDVKNEIKNKQIGLLSNRTSCN